MYCNVNYQNAHLKNRFNNMQDRESYIQASYYV